MILNVKLTKLSFCDFKTTYLIRHNSILQDRANTPYCTLESVMLWKKFYI